jgi:hypothetical protein
VPTSVAAVSESELLYLVERSAVSGQSETGLTSTRSRTQRCIIISMSNKLQLSEMPAFYHRFFSVSTVKVLGNQNNDSGHLGIELSHDSTSPMQSFHY